jgi:large subunit ribosomal protein L36
MKVRRAVKRLCEHCFVARRKGKLFIVCRKNPKVCGREVAPAAACAAGRQWPRIHTTPG